MGTDIMRPALAALALLATASPILAQSTTSTRLPAPAQIGQINRGTVPDLIDLRINNGTFPRYGTGSDIDIRSAVIKADGPKARILLHLTLDDKKVLIQPQAQMDGRLVAHLPADLYGREQLVITTIVVGDETLVNKSGRFVPVIEPVAQETVDRGVTVRCVVMCLTWPASKNVQPHWLSRDEIYDSFEHRAPIDEEVGGKWSVGQTTYLIESRKLKDQFRFTDISISSPIMSGGCPVQANENVWVYPATALPLPEPPFTVSQLNVYARSNVTHCRLRGRNNLDANHFVYTRLRIRIAIEGPKGIDPWQ